MLRKLLLVLFLLSCLWAVGYSQELSSKEQEILHQLEAIEIESYYLEALSLQNEQSEKNLNDSILKLEKEIQNSLTVSNEQRQRFESYLQLLAKLQQQQKISAERLNELEKESKKLYKQLNDLKAREKWLVGGLIATGIIIIVESVILFAK